MHSKADGFDIFERSSSASSSTARRADAAAPFKSKLAVEGELLPIADAALENDAEAIEARLQQRLLQKASSAALGAQASDEGGMFRILPTDRTVDETVAFQVRPSQEFLDNFQNVFRRLRRNGRRGDDERDVSDSMLKTLLYMKKRKAAAGRGEGDSGSG